MALVRAHHQVAHAGLVHVLDLEADPPPARQGHAVQRQQRFLGRALGRLPDDALLFDLLTALLDSWTVWNSVAGSEAAGGMWRAEYLRLTYGCGAYVPYEQLVRTAARTAPGSLAACSR